MHGEPVFRGTRVPVQTLFDHTENGESLSEVNARNFVWRVSKAEAHPMKILLDDCVDQRLRLVFAGHDCQAAACATLAGLQNGVFLAAAKVVNGVSRVASFNAVSQRGYSRDHRPDCKQVDFALVMGRCGMSLGYELFAGNKADVTTVEDMANHIEGRVRSRIGSG